MVKKEYRAFSYNEAVKLATQDKFNVLKNKTVKWENSGRPDGVELKTFTESVLKDLNAKNASDGFMIVVDKGVKDIKTRPYKINNVSNNGASKFVTKHEVCRKDTGEVVGSANSKSSGVKLMKTKVTELKTDCVLRKVKRVVGNDVEATGNYVPSSKTNLGTYWFVGNDIDNF